MSLIEKDVQRYEEKLRREFNADGSRKLVQVRIGTFNADTFEMTEHAVFNDWPQGKVVERVLSDRPEVTTEHMDGGEKCWACGKVRWDHAVGGFGVEVCEEPERKLNDTSRDTISAFYDRIR